MRNTVLRNIIVGLELFVALMAIYGGINLLANAEGFGMNQGWLHGSPFANYQVPALILLFGVGGSSLVASVEAWRRGRFAVLLTTVAGVVLLLFEVVEVAAIGLRNFQQPLMFAAGTVLCVAEPALNGAGREKRGEPREHAA